MRWSVVTALIWLAALGRWSWGPQEHLHTELLNQDPPPPQVPGGAKTRPAVPTALPLQAQCESLTFPSAAKLSDTHQLPKSSLSDVVYSCLLHTDFSRKSGKVRVMSQSFKWELLSFLDYEWGKWVMWGCVLAFGNSQCAQMWFMGQLTQEELSSHAGSFICPDFDVSLAKWRKSGSIMYLTNWTQILRANLKKE